MPKKVELVSRQIIFKKFIFSIEEAVLKHELFDGSMSPVMTRLNLERGDSVSVLLHDPLKDEVLLVEQFRFPTYTKTGGWLLETAAGIIDHADGESPRDAARREIEEEVGYRIQNLKFIATFYLSPGGSSERIHLFYAAIQPEQRVSKGGGLLSEDENIREVVLKLSTAFDMLDRGDIIDAKTFIALQWMRLGRHKSG